jgi:Flp pilus assembly protein TadD
VRDLQGQFDEAQALYREALAAHPEDAAARSNLGLSLALAGQPREAVNVLLDVATRPSAPPQARQNLALAYGLMGNDEAAESVLSTEMERTAVRTNLDYYRYVRGRAAGGAR